ncbi:hypothetical protein GOHSU_12_01190 [Gordonia hirsuta DSM 44140 = NBRC 16056]|uniref:Uncharacterized protein n=1 Tax=Gordonia hirsuta DSM 44140 = NBRC 16056 TaxID=1121927 RepID=L7L720_9ACTN|nr:hypothetical protein [Gordonia hirsuta]GAC56729.1 hypothetical protein GOHSU_12_01190 [Gordonia hirsuta DSM 44140 = NBRC 16056]
MTPVEINAGAWYLRALRADDRLSDLPALTDLSLADSAGYLAQVLAADDADLADVPEAADDPARLPVRCVWAVCIPTTGELAAVIGVRGTPERSELRGLHRPGMGAALAESAPAVLRYAQQALGLTPGSLQSAPP